MRMAPPAQLHSARHASLAIFVATMAELKPLASALQPTHRPVGGSNPSTGLRTGSMARVELEGRNLLLVRTGMGPENAEAAARHLFEALPVAAAFAVGVAGGLSQEVQRGDLIVGDRAILRRSSGQVLRGEKGTMSVSFPCDSGLQEAALTAIRRFDSRHHLGPILTVDRIVPTAEEKRQLAEDSGAVAVDMESATIASVAMAYSIPFLAIRGVLDPVEENLTIAFDHFLDNRGEPQLFSLLRYLLAHPLALPRLVGLGLRTKAVCARLGRLLHALSTTLR